MVKTSRKRFRMDRGQYPRENLVRDLLYRTTDSRKISQSLFNTLFRNNRMNASFLCLNINAGGRMRINLAVVL